MLNHKPSSNLPALEPTMAIAERSHRQDATIDSGRMQGPLYYQFQQPRTKNDCPHLQVRAVSSLYRINHAPLLPLPLGILRDPPCGSPRRSNPSTAALAPPRKLSLLLLLLLLLPLVSHLRLRLPALPRVLRGALAGSHHRRVGGSPTPLRRFALAGTLAARTATATAARKYLLLLLLLLLCVSALKIAEATRSTTCHPARLLAFQGLTTEHRGG